MTHPHPREVPGIRPPGADPPLVGYTSRIRPPPHRNLIPGESGGLRAVYLPLNRIVVVGPRPPAPTAATWKRYFLPLRTLALNTRLVVVFHALYFFPPGLEIRTR